MRDTSSESTTMTGQPEEALLVRYLVGACSEDEKARVEEQLFADDEVYGRLRLIEEELIERRLRGELPEAEREQFDRAYAAPSRRERVLFAQALQRVLSDEQPNPAADVAAARDESPKSWWSVFTRPGGFRLAFATMALLLVAAVVAWRWEASSLRSSLQTARADNEALRQQLEADKQRADALLKRTDELNEELGRERASRSSPPGAPRGLIATFVLLPGRVRAGGAPTRIVIRPSMEDVRLQLDLESGVDYPNYRVELRNSESRVLWSQQMVRPTRTADGPSVVITVPTASLEPGEHEVVLLGTVDARQYEDAGHYYFDVAKPR